MTALAALLEQLDADRTPSAPHRFAGEFRRLRTRLHESGEEVSEELAAEETAFSVYRASSDETTEWGIYFGPFMSWEAATGERLTSPSLGDLSLAVLEYWRSRAQHTSHPVMRSRYADLLWEVPQVVDCAQPDHQMARLAIESYVEAVADGLYSTTPEAIRAVQRALDLALTLNDGSAVGSTVGALVRLEHEVADDDKLGTWGFSFDRIMLGDTPGLATSDEVQARLLLDMESRLARAAASGAGPLHPFAVEAAATRLATYYRRIGHHDGVSRVMAVYSSTVCSMSSEGAPIVRYSSLEKLYDQLRSFGLHDQAHELEGAIRTLGGAVLEDMSSISVEHELSNEQIEAFFRELLDGEARAVLDRLALHFIPDLTRAHEQVQSLARDAPLTYLTNISLKDHKGRTVATVGPLDTDLEGHVARQVGMNLQFGAPWLAEALRRAIENETVSVDGVVQALSDSPAFDPAHIPIIEHGVRYFWASESIAAIHVIVPQIEQGVRNIADLCGVPLMTPRRNGGFRYRALESLLREPRVREGLGRNLAAYLAVLLTDPRGWNIRNDVCHGLLPAAGLTGQVADRVFHALVALTLVRERAPLDSVAWLRSVARLAWNEIADLIGCSPGTLRRWRQAATVPEKSAYLPALEHLWTLCALIQRHPSSLGEVCSWLRTPLPELDGRSPMAAWRDGSYESVTSLLCAPDPDPGGSSLFG